MLWLLSSSAAVTLQLPSKQRGVNKPGPANNGEFNNHNRPNFLLLEVTITTPGSAPFFQNAARCAGTLATNTDTTIHVTKFAQQTSV